MLISGVILNEKHPKMYQLGLWFFLPLKDTTSILKWFAPVALHLKNLMFHPEDVFYITPKWVLFWNKKNFIPRLHAR